MTLKLPLSAPLRLRSWSVSFLPVFQGGLPGLLLRLRADGHGQLRLVSQTGMSLHTV